MERHFVVGRMGEVEYKVKAYDPAEDERVQYVFQSPEGHQLMVTLDGATGGLSLGGWNESGEYIELVPAERCTNKPCWSKPNHLSGFELDQYVKAGEPEGELLDGYGFAGVPN